jgi:hypothetical protein
MLTTPHIRCVTPRASSQVLRRSGIAPSLPSARLNPPGPKSSSTPTRLPPSRHSPALIRARDRRVNVGPIADSWSPCEQGEGFGSPWQASGADRRPGPDCSPEGLIIDHRVLDFSAVAARNSENLNVVTSVEVAGAYTAHCTRQARAVLPYEGGSRVVRKGSQGQAGASKHSHRPCSCLCPRRRTGQRRTSRGA